MSGVNIYFARFKCHIDTDRNHYKANFINIVKRTMFLRQKTVKQVFQNGLLSIYVFSYFLFGFEDRMGDLIVSVPDHCLSFYFE